jgi:NAD(P)-dependent dehydrogenase (short-subunit alcohol dehydrogenase family)
MTPSEFPTVQASIGSIVSMNSFGETRAASTAGTHEAKWFKPHPPYSIAKYTMSLFTLALAAEFAEHGIAVNSLWPRTVIATAAVLYELGGDGPERHQAPSRASGRDFASLEGEPLRSRVSNRRTYRTNFDAKEN